MGHLRENKLIKATVSASGWVAKQGLSAGLKFMGVASGPVGWVLSFLGKKIIENKIMPYSKALGIKATMHWQMRTEKKLWSKEFDKLHKKTKDKDFTEAYIEARKRRARRNKKNV